MFDLSSNPIPFWATDVYLQVVYNGRLGSEDSAVAVGFKDISDPTPVDLYNNMDRICLNGNWYITASTDAMNQAPLGWDIYAQNIQNGYLKIASASDAAYASPSHYTFSMGTIPPGILYRAYILSDSDYPFTYSDYAPVVATTSEDTADHTKAILTGHIVGSAIKNQVDYHVTDQAACDEIGETAPCDILTYPLLYPFRLLQGLAFGCQWGGAALLATESAPKGRRGWYVGIAQAAPAVGVLLANIAFLAASGAMSPEAFMAYGWRIPFLLSVVLVGLGLYVHFRVEETQAYRKLQVRNPRPADASAGAAVPEVNAPAAHSLARPPSPIIEALRRYPGRILLAAGVFVPSNAAFYLGITYVVAYGTSVAGLALPRSTMLGAVMVSSAVSIPVGFLAGKLSDRHGRRRIIMTGVTLMAAWTFAMFALLETRAFLWISVALTVSGAINSVIYAPLAAMFAELFDTRVRYSAMSLAYQLAAIPGGAVTPILATSLYARFHTNAWIATYMAVSCAVALACVVPGSGKPSRWTSRNQAPCRRPSS